MVQDCHQLKIEYLRGDKMDNFPPWFWLKQPLACQKREQVRTFNISFYLFIFI